MAKTEAKPATGRKKVVIVQIRLDPETYLAFRELALHNGQMVPGRLRVLIRKDIEVARQTDPVAGRMTG